MSFQPLVKLPFPAALLSAVGIITFGIKICRSDSGLLCIVDQHAASERVGLERLERRLIAETASQEDGGNQQAPLLRSVPLLPAQAISLSPGQFAVVQQNEHLLRVCKSTDFALKASNHCNDGSSKAPPTPAPVSGGATTAPQPGTSTPPPANSDAATEAPTNCRRVIP